MAGTARSSIFPSPALIDCVQSLVSSERAPWTIFLLFLHPLWQLFSLLSCKSFSLLPWKVGTVQRGDTYQHSSIVRLPFQAGETVHVVSLRVWNFVKVSFTFSTKKSIQEDTCACPVCRQHLSEAVWVPRSASVRTQCHPSLCYSSQPLLGEMGFAKLRPWSEPWPN